MFFVEGGHPLHGSVRVDGSKNACLPIMAASLAINGEVVLQQVPQLRDIVTMRQLLQSIGATLDFRSDGAVQIDSRNVRSSVAPYELVRQMRAGVCVLGPLLTRFGHARVSLPGGCNIGHRPIDLHLRGLAALGADIRLEGGYILAEARQLRGADVDLCGPHGPTVTGTCNVMMAAALAKGHTIIRSAAREPEVQDFAQFLNRAGARISGVGTSIVEIQGVEQLHNVCHTVIPDRIEAATLALAAAITRGNVMIHNAPTMDMTRVLNTLVEIGVTVDTTENTLHVRGSAPRFPRFLMAEPYPGLPTDCQAQFMALLSTVPGRSEIIDRVFPERFMHAAELVRMGADIHIHGNTAMINGVTRLSAAPVMASDLRASAALVLAALAAEGRSEIRRVYHLDRGYHAFETKLNQLGAHIRRVNDECANGIPRPHSASRFAVAPTVDRPSIDGQTRFAAVDADPE
ncbi:MAG: UDP-N-acetylglucosamine 1-carboxyvinyltransferase [Planctomycetaceae bacterium]